MMRPFRCNPGKRELVLRVRGVDLFDAARVFDDPNCISFADERFDYGEARYVAIGRVGNRMYTLVFTLRDGMTWLITAWKSNRKERKIYGQD